MHWNNRSKQEILSITGFNLEEFATLLFIVYAWLITNKSPEIVPGTLLADKSISEKIPIVTEENIQKCIALFTADYDFYRKTDHPNNPLFFKPIVRTQTGRLMIANAFLWGRKFYEGIYWLIRGKYLEANSRDFTASCGKYYEQYVEQILNYYLKNDDFEKIEQEGKADWYIYTDKYLLIIEQKSSLMSIALKREYPSKEQFNEYLEILKKAIKQLKNTENSVNENRIIIKMVLTFEKLYFKDAFIKEELNIAYSSEENANPLEHCYFIDTEEFEQLIQILAGNNKKFDEIIATKMAYEKEPPAPIEGRDFKDIISKIHGWKLFKFLEDKKYIFDQLIEKY